MPHGKNRYFYEKISISYFTLMPGDGLVDLNSLLNVAMNIYSKINSNNEKC